MSYYFLILSFKIYMGLFWKDVHDINSYQIIKKMRTYNLQGVLQIKYFESINRCTKAALTWDPESQVILQLFYFFFHPSEYKIHMYLMGKYDIFW